jgi:hypothetical protein
MQNYKYRLQFALKLVYNYRKLSNYSLNNALESTFRSLLQSPADADKNIKQVGTPAAEGFTCSSSVPEVVSKTS